MEQSGQRVPVGQVASEPFNPRSGKRRLAVREGTDPEPAGEGFQTLLSQKAGSTGNQNTFMERIDE